MAAGVESFEEFFEAEHARLFAALCLITGDRYEAEEVMQDAFLAIWERWGRVRAMESPTGYLYRTAMNAFRRRARRASLAVRRAAGLVPQDDAFAAVEARALVLHALGKLSPRQRAAIVLTGLLGFSSDEAGRMLGIAPQTVRVLATRARGAMRELVGQER